MNTDADRRVKKSIITTKDQSTTNRSSRRFTAMAPQFCSMVLVHARHILPLFFLLLSQSHLASCLKPVHLAVQTNATTANSSHCIVIWENAEVVKQIGAVWTNVLEPCAIHACESDETGRAQETISSKDCEQFYCDVDSELQPQEGTCCGHCVRTKCRFKDNVYDVGQIWQNAADCTQLECVKLINDQPIINAHQKSCPELPSDCVAANIYVENCCQYCNKSRSDNVSFNAAPRAILDEMSSDIWTEEFYSKHPCRRECQINEEPRTCHYNFVVEWFETLSKACYECPQNASDCFRPHCIVGDGIPRSITVVNRMMPGPSIEVCERDMIIVDVHNQLLGESTTIHWHGIHQRHTPYMDGVPHITQCPISPHATFRYAFEATHAGTQFWHSHTGMQRGDGVFGAFIVRRPHAADPHGHLYDFDLTEHKMIVQDWVHVPGVSMFASHHHSRGDNKPRNLLINGRGRYYKAIWDAAKSETKQNRANNVQSPAEVKDVEATIAPILATSNDIPESLMDDVDFLHPLKMVERITILQREKNEISRAEEVAQVQVSVNPNTTILSSMKQSDFAAPKNYSNTESIEPDAATTVPSTTLHAIETIVETSHMRQKRATDDDLKIALDKVPLQVYNVRRGFRYRFRIINAEFLNCPIAISIDKHNMTAISSDGYDFEAVEVGSIVTYAGERFDFILQANQPIGNYWVRLKGLMDCSEKFTSAFQVAVLRYEGASAVEPSAVLGYNNYDMPGVELNAMNRGSGQENSLTVAELTALPNYDTVSGIDRDALNPVADYKFFVYYDFYSKDNPVFHPSGLYGINDSLGVQNQLYTPQLNHISLKFPAGAMLPARNQLDESLFCNETSLEAAGIDCRKQFCQCHHVLSVPLNAIVELIIIDEGYTYDANHPFHLHGNAFRVVGLERLGQNVTVEMVKQLDRYNLLKRNLARPPVKDTVTIPDGGYTIVRFEASNPGFWLFHCHIEFHAEIGMALVIKVGNNEDMVPVPRNFPTCHDYMPDEKSNSQTTPSAANEQQNTNQPSMPQATTPIPPTEAGTSRIALSSPPLLLLLCALISYRVAILQ